MIFIIGGSYQGKCDFAKVKFGLKDSDLFVCEGDSVDLSARAIAHIERFALSCVQKGEEPKAFWAAHRADLEDKILIADDSKMNQQILSEILGGRYEYLMPTTACRRSSCCTPSSTSPCCSTSICPASTASACSR